MELYISDHPLDCLTCPANGDCELQDMAGVVGLREVRYGLGDAAPTTSTPRATTTNPYFTFDASQVHRLLALRAGLRRGAGHLRPHHRGPRLRLEGRARAGDVASWTPSASRAAPACRPARRRRCRRRPSSSSACPPARVETTCAYCGVGCSFKAELRGDELVRMVPSKAGGANEGHSLRQGPLRLRLRHPPRPRARRRWSATRSPTSPGARSRWDEAIAFTARRLHGDPGRARRRLHRRHHLLALHQRGGLRRPEDGARRLRQQQRRHLRPGLPLAHRLRPQADVRHLGRHPGLQVRRRSPT